MNAPPLVHAARAAVLAMAILFGAVASPAVVGPVPARAQNALTVPPPTPEEVRALLAPDRLVAGRPVRLDLPLSLFVPEPGPLRLQGADSAQALVVPIARSLDVTAADLSLAVTGSIALVEPSFLTLHANGPAVAQIPLTRTQGRFTATVDLGPDALAGGANRLLFRAVQHYTDSCEDPGAPQLWSEIDPERSRLGLTVTRRAMDYRLTDLDWVFRRAIGGFERIRIVTASDGLADGEIAAAARVAEGIALRRPSGLPGFRHHTASDWPRPTVPPPPATGGEQPVDPGPFPGLDPALFARPVVLVGVRDAVAPLVEPALAARLEEAYVGLHPSPVDPGLMAIVVSGPDDAALMRAANAFASARFPFSDGRETTVADVALPPAGIAVGPPALAHGRTYTFADLGLADRTVRGQAAQAVDVDFTLPPTGFVTDDTIAFVDLSFVYGSGMRTDSALNVFLNDAFIESIDLSNPQGELIRDFRLPIPLSRFRPGANRLSVAPVMKLDLADPCAIRNEANLVTTLFASSAIVLPPVGEFVSLPDLRLLSRTGYPYAGVDGAELVVHGTDGATVAAGFTVAARLAQVAGRPLHDTAVRVVGAREDAGAPGTHRLHVGALPDLPFAPVDGPIRLGEQPGARHTVDLRPEGAPSPSWVDGWAAPVRDVGRVLGLWAPTEAPPREALRVLGATDPGRNGLMLGFPDTGGAHLTTVITARDPEMLLARVDHLVEPGFWFQLQGGTAAWRDRADVFATQPPDTTFGVGDLGAADRVAFLSSVHPNVWAAFVVGVLAVLGLLTWLVVSSLRRKRKAG